VLGNTLSHYSPFFGGGGYFCVESITPLLSRGSEMKNNYLKFREVSLIDCLNSLYTVGLNIYELKQKKLFSLG